MEKIKIIKENSNTGGGMVYCLGWLGAVIYYFQHANTFGEYVLGFLKSLVWPAFLIHKVLEYLQM